MKGVKSEVMKYVKLACIVDQLLGLASGIRSYGSYGQ